MRTARRDTEVERGRKKRRRTVCCTKFQPPQKQPHNLNKRVASTRKLIYNASTRQPESASPSLHRHQQPVSSADTWLFSAEQACLDICVATRASRLPFDSCVMMHTRFKCT